MFWGPGAEKCEKAPRSRLFAPKRTFRAKVAFGWKSAFWAQKAIFGDSGGISPNLEWEFIWFGAFCGFWVFRDAEIDFSWKILHFHVNFIKKWILCLFTTFRAASRKTPSDFATPLMLFVELWSRIKVPRRKSKFHVNGDFTENGAFLVEFHQNGGSGVIFTLSAPRARKHTNSLSHLELFEVPWEPKWSFLLNSTKFSGKSTFYPQSDILHILAF